jgi:hypothetical protein
VKSSTVQIFWFVAIMTWAVMCGIGWFIATRDDYAKLKAASACYGTNAGSPISDPQRANVKQSDIRIYKAEIDRKARISRLTAAFGSGAAITLWFLLGRPGLSVKKSL